MSFPEISAALSRHYSFPFFTPAAFQKEFTIEPEEEAVLRIEDEELRITTMKQRLERAQRVVRKHVKPGTSLVDELIAERREAARRELE